MTTPQKNRRLFWSIVDQLEAAIDNGTYPVGVRLPSERELSELYHVSRPTLREAIIALEVRERVEVRTSAGVYVLPLQKKASQHSAQISAFELTQARALIEGEAAALAANAITEAELQQLEHTLLQLQSESTAEAADREFHLIISKATKNNAILMSVENLWEVRATNPDVQEAYRGICSQSASKRQQEHLAIYQALKNRDPAAARNAMHGHFNRLINALFEASEAKALEEIRKKTTATRDLYSLDYIVSSR